MRRFKLAMDENLGLSAGAGHISINLWPFLFERSWPNDQMCAWSALQPVIGVFWQSSLSEYNSGSGEDSSIHFKCIDVGIHFFFVFCFLIS